MAKGITGLSHIGVRVSDMDRSLKFYVNDLGFELTDMYVRGASTLAFLNAGTCNLELICNSTVDVAALRAGNIDHFCCECDNIKEMLAKLEGKVELIGGINEMPEVQGGVINVFFKGPDGERIELFEHTRVKRSI